MRVSPAIAASSSRQRALLAALLTIVVSLLAGLGMRQPNPPDEPRFVLAARTMVETGQWLLPHRGSELYAEKPPAFMWLQAATYELVPHWPVAFLLPSLLAALATLWLTWDIARRLWTRRVAAHAVLALFTVLQFGLMAKRAQIDMVLVALTTLSLWGLLRHLLRGPDWRAWTLGLFAAGVGTVTKGVGFLPLLVLLPWMALRRTHWRVLPARALAGRSWALVLPAFVAGTAVWLGPLGIALWHSDDTQLHAYAHELLFKQTGTRYAHAWHHVKPFWYYLQVIATLWLPGCLLLPWLLPAWWRRLRRGDPRYVLLLAWSVLVLLFFSASPGKREVYIFPMLPALCIA
ncbi:ArnT family glycosyltransferase, partial [Xanthomonas euvesicatoria]